VRTQRSAERLQAVGYADADGSLRVSYGRVMELPSDHTFVSDSDGFSGNSGSPTLNREGEVLGYM
jgi:S1-C subfamily serine protease